MNSPASCVTEGSYWGCDALCRDFFTVSGEKKTDKETRKKKKP